MKAFFLTDADLLQGARETIEETAQLLAGSPWAFCDVVQTIMAGSPDYDVNRLFQARTIREQVLYAVLLCNPEGLSEADLVPIVYARLSSLLSLLPLFLSGAIIADDDALIMEISRPVLCDEYARELQAARLYTEGADLEIGAASIRLVTDSFSRDRRNIKIPYAIWKAVNYGLDAMELTLWTASKPCVDYNIRSVAFDMQVAHDACLAHNEGVGESAGGGGGKASFACRVVDALRKVKRFFCRLVR